MDDGGFTRRETHEISCPRCAETNCICGSPAFEGWVAMVIMEENAADNGAHFEREALRDL